MIWEKIVWSKIHFQIESELIIILSLFNISTENRKIYSARRRTSETQLQDEAREEIPARDQIWSLLKKSYLRFQWDPCTTRVISWVSEITISIIIEHYERNESFTTSKTD